MPLERNLIAGEKKLPFQSLNVLDGSFYWQLCKESFLSWMAEWFYAMLKDEAVKTDINEFYYLSRLSVYLGVFVQGSVLWKEAISTMLQLLCLMNIPYDICIWCFYFLWRLVFSSSFLTPESILGMFITYREWKLFQKPFAVSWLAISSCWLNFTA